MRIDELRKILVEFAREARQGIITENRARRDDLAGLAEQLEARLASAVRLNEIKSSTISFSPDKCPTCGK